MSARIEGYTYGTNYFAELLRNTNPEFFGNPYMPKVVEYANAVGIHADGRTQAPTRDQRKLKEYQDLALEWQTGFNAAGNDTLSNTPIYNIIYAVNRACYNQFK